MSGFDGLVAGLVDALMRLYPPAFRERFGESMRVDLIEGWRARRGLAGRLGYWLRVIPDAVLAAGAERLAESRRDSPVAPARTGFGDSIDRLVDDLRHAARRLRRQPAETAVAVVTLAVGLGIAAAVYALVDGVLLRPLPYPEPERLVRIWSVDPEGELRFLEATADELRRFRDVPAFAAVGGLSTAPRDLSDDTGRPMGIDIMRISEGVFDVLGIEPVLGRRITRAEIVESRAVVVLSHAFWRSRYAADPEVLGRTLAIQGEPHEIVGVLPPGLDGDLGQNAAVWRPFTREENQDDDRELIVLARLAGPPDVGDALAQANGQVAAAAATAPNSEADGATAHGAWVQPLHAMLVRDVRGPLWTLLGAVAAVLLLAASNVTHLQLSKVAGRRREMALRTALGAAPGRLTHQLLIEVLVLASLAGVGGVVLGSLLLDLFRRLAPADLPRLADVALDARVVVVMAAVSAATGLLAGWLPARRSAKVAPAEALGGRDELAAAGSRFHGTLVVAEVALATVLVATAGLLFASLAARLDVEHGVDLDHTIHLALSPPPSADDGPAREAFYHRMVEAVATLPGVEAVGIGSFQPLEPRGFAMPWTLASDDATPTTDRRATTWAVDAGWLDAAGVRRLAGRGFDPELDGSEGVAIVDRTFVRQHFGVDDPAVALGQRIRHRAYWGDERPSEHRIIGVVEAMRAEASTAPRPRLYLPYRHFPWPRMKLLVRTAGDPTSQLETLRARLWSVEPEAPLDRAVPLSQLVEQRLADQRFQLRLVGGFAYLALLLAAVGFYAVLSTTIAGRTRELGVRRALGAGRGDIVGQVLGQAFRWVAPGLAIGLGGAWWVGQLLTRQLHGVEAVEPDVWALVTATLLGVTLLVCWRPARRALEIDPMTVLRD